MIHQINAQYSPHAQHFDSNIRHLKWSAEDITDDIGHDDAYFAIKWPVKILLHSHLRYHRDHFAQSL